MNAESLKNYYMDAINFIILVFVIPFLWNYFAASITPRLHPNLCQNNGRYMRLEPLARLHQDQHRV